MALSVLTLSWSAWPDPKVPRQCEGVFADIVWKFGWLAWPDPKRWTALVGPDPKVQQFNYDLIDKF